MAALCMKCKWSQDLKEGLFNILVPAQEASQSFGYSARLLFLSCTCLLSPISTTSASLLGVLRFWSIQSPATCDLSPIACANVIFLEPKWAILKMLWLKSSLLASALEENHMCNVQFDLFSDFSLNNPGRNLMEVINYVAQKAKNFLVRHASVSSTYPCK